MAWARPVPYRADRYIIAGLMKERSIAMNAVAYQELSKVAAESAPAAALEWPTHKEPELT
jgi:hypothetical protein